MAALQLDGWEGGGRTVPANAAPEDVVVLAVGAPIATTILPSPLGDPTLTPLPSLALTSVPVMVQSATAEALVAAFRRCRAAVLPTAKPYTRPTVSVLLNALLPGAATTSMSCVCKTHRVTRVTCCDRVPPAARASPSPPCRRLCTCEPDTQPLKLRARAAQGPNLCSRCVCLAHAQRTPQTHAARRVAMPRVRRWRTSRHAHTGTLRAGLHDRRR